MSNQKERMARIEKESIQMLEIALARHGLRTNKAIAFFCLAIIALLYAGYFIASDEMCLLLAVIFTVTLPFVVCEYFSEKNKVKALENQRVAK